MPTANQPTSEEQAAARLLVAAEHLANQLGAALKPLDLTLQQYSVLRILGDAAPEGCACAEIGSGMYTRSSDVTRLLQRLEARGLVSRGKAPRDRRVVRTRITDEGRRSLQKATPEVQKLLQEQFSSLSGKRFRRLTKTLGRLSGSNGVLS